MAKKLNYKKSVTETINAKGILNDSATVLTYTDDDKNECTIKMQELLDKFASQEVSFTIKTVADEELEIEPPYDEVDINDLSE